MNSIHVKHSQNLLQNADHPVLELCDIHKSFGGAQALDGASFSIRRGEIHAIVGENGAGKSTLMNILAGVYSADSGEIFLNGERYAPSNPHAAQARGIRIVFQELALFPTLNVEANLFAGKEMMKGVWLDHQAMRERAEMIIDEMTVDLFPTDQVDRLTIGQRQWVEIARALTEDAQVIILDEPNSALNQYETEALFELIARLKLRGITLIYISHRLEEVFRIADRITVMRDGRYIGSWIASETSTTEIVAAMVGRRTTDLYSRAFAGSELETLQVEGLSVAGKVEPVSFSARAGEVVGLAGLAGSGVSDLLEALFGIKRIRSGKIKINGKPVVITSPRKAIENDIAMVPADRRGLGLMMNWSVLDNITLSVLARVSRAGIIRHRYAREIAADYVQRLRIVTDSLEKKVLYLSGGNQQKALLGRWLATEPGILILDDPTRGIDVGAKQEVYYLVDQIAAGGVSVLFTSSELEETLALCDRILVLRHGRMVAEVPRDVADKALITELMAGDLASGLSQLRERYRNRVQTLATSGESQHTQTASDPEMLAYRMPEPQTSHRWYGAVLRRLLGIREAGVLLALIAVLLLFSLLTPHFLTTSNLLLISRQMAILGVITAGMTFVLASGEVDLSVGWIFNMVMGAMAILMTRHGIDPWLTLPLGLLLGMLLGAVNGLLAVVLELPSIIVTLGTLTLYRGLALAINGGRTVGNLPESSFFQIGSGSIGAVSNMTLIMLIVFIGAALILRNARFARHLLAMGSNRQAAQRVGIATGRLRVMVMMFSGLMCGIAGVLGIAFLGAADPQSGTGYELTAIAAAIIGGAQLGGGSGTIWGSLVGIALIMAIQNGLVLMGLRPAWQIASTGFVIIAAVTLDYLTRTRRQNVVARMRYARVKSKRVAMKGGEWIKKQDV